MNAAIASLFVVFISALLWLVLGPVLASLIIAVMLVIIAAVALPVVIILLPWLLIGGLVWIIGG